MLSFYISDTIISFVVICLKFPQTTHINIVRGFDTLLGLSSGICGKKHLQSLAIILAFSFPILQTLITTLSFHVCFGNMTPTYYISFGDLCNDILK
jgi:hypothetical protein